MTQAVEKVCNRVLFMGDDYRYNESAMGCELPMGHDGPHQHMYEGPHGGKVTIVFEKGFARLRIERVQHMIPAGETCWFDDGRACPSFSGAGRVAEAGPARSPTQGAGRYSESII